MVANSTDDSTGVSSALLQVSSEKVATQGTNAVNVSNTNISSSIAALRGGAIGISINGLTYNLNGQRIPFNARKSQNYYDHQYSGTEVASNNIPLAFALASQAETDTMESPFGEKLGIFVNGLVTFDDKDRTSREAGFYYHALGITGGVDYRFTDFLVAGAAFSYVNGSVDLDSNAYSISLYGSIYFLDNFYIGGIGTLGWINYDQTRNIVYRITGTDPINQTAKSDFDANQYAFSFTTGYDFNYSGFTFGPFGQLNYIKADVDGYSEKISGDDAGLGLGLRVKDQDVKSLSTVLGVQGSYAWSTTFGVVLPQVLFGWQHEYEDDARIITATFINDTTNTGILDPTDGPDRDYFDLGLGLSAQLPHGISSFIYYRTVLAYEDLSEHSFVGGLRIGL